jgi:hypothetical protein
MIVTIPNKIVRYFINFIAVTSFFSKIPFLSLLKEAESILLLDKAELFLEDTIDFSFNSSSCCFSFSLK